MLHCVTQTSNSAWSPTLFLHSPMPERLKDLSLKNWTQLAGSGPVPWRQAPSLFGSSIATSEMSSRIPYEVVDISSALNKLSTGERITVSSLEKRKIEDLSERIQNGCLKLGAREIIENGTAGTDSFKAFSRWPNPERQMSCFVIFFHVYIDQV